VVRMGETRSPYTISVEKPEDKRPLRRTRHRLYNNIKMNLQK